MQTNLFSIRLRSLLIFISFIVIVTSCQKSITKPNDPGDEVLGSSAEKNLKDFVQVNLVSDMISYHPVRIDPNLVNAWGIAFAPTGPAWVSAEGTGLSVIYNTLGNDVRPPVTIPSHGSLTGGHPTGQVFNSSNDFKLPNGNPARFIFAADDGLIAGWNAGNAAIKMVDDAPDASYFGITIATDNGANFLYVANFSERKISVYDANWNEVNKPFKDNHLPDGYSPFNIQNIDGKLFVMYAKVDPATGDEIHAAGLGIVDIYNPNGTLVKRFATRDKLNSPWGAVKTPAGFLDNEDDDKAKGGHHEDASVILIGNFGDGRINVYSLDGDFEGQLRSHNKTIEIDGLWAISFAPTTATTIDPSWLFFAAGPDDETHGLFGYLKQESKKDDD